MRFAVVVLLFAIANATIWWAVWPEPAAVVTEPGTGQESVEQPVVLSPLAAPTLVGAGEDLRERVPLQWTFAAPMQMTATPGPGTIKPAVAGVWQWLDHTTLQFTPDADWPVATAFTATLHGLALHAVDGRQLNADHIEPVASPGPQVVWSGSRANRAGAIEIGLRFDQAVAPSAVLDHLLITDERDRPVVPSLAADTADDDTAVWLHIPSVTNSTEQTFHLQVAAGLVGLDGPQPGPATTLAITHRHQAVLERAASSSARRGIVLRFSGPVDAATLRDHLTIEPALPVTVEQDWDSAVCIKGRFTPGQRYQVHCPASADTTAVSATVRVPWDACAVDVKQRRGLLAMHGAQRLRATVTNCSALEAEVWRLDAASLPAWLSQAGEGSNYAARSLGQALGKRSVPVAPAIGSQEVDIDLGALLQRPLEAGAYVVQLRATALHADEPWYQHDSTTCVIIPTTSMMTARIDAEHVHIWQTRLADTTTMAASTISLISDRARIVGSGVTDHDGHTAVRYHLERGEELVGVVARSATNDAISWLDLDRHRLDDAGCDITGIDHPRSGYRAFCFADRGLYRAGETVPLRALIRAHDGSTPPAGLPVEWTITRPNGIAWQTLPTTTSSSGAIATTITLPADASPGRWQMTLHLAGGGTTLGRHTVTVRSFVPQRLALSWDFADPDTWVLAGQTRNFDGRATWLHGGPVTDGGAEVAVTVDEQPFTPAGWEAWRFGISTGTPVHWRDDAMAATMQADGQITASISDTTLAQLDASGPLHVTSTLRVRPAGGREQSMQHRTVAHPFSSYPGLQFQGQAGDMLQWDLAIVDPDGQVVDSTERFTAQLIAVHETGYWAETNGRWRWRQRRDEQPLGDASAITTANGRARISLPAVADGLYRLEITAADGRRVDDERWHGAGTRGVHASDHPTRLSFTAKVIDDAVHLQIEAPWDGRLLVTAERDRMLSWHSQDWSTDSGTIVLPLPADATPEFFIHACIIKAFDPQEAGPGSIHRLRGLARVQVPDLTETLTATLDVPTHIRPTATSAEIPLAIAVTDPHGAAIANADVCFLVVDQGIRALDPTPTPDPLAWWRQPRRLAVSGHDGFDDLLPEWLPTGTSDPGGAEDIDLSAYRAPVSAEVQTLALASPWLTTNADGIARWQVPCEQFNGRCQVIAVVHAGRRLGSAQATTTVRATTRIEVAWPLFIAPGDMLRLPVRLQHDGDALADVTLTSRITGLGNDRTRTHRLSLDGTDRLLELPIQAKETGSLTMSLKLTDGLGKLLAMQEQTLLIRDPAPPRQVVDWARATPREPTLLANLVPAPPTGQVVIQAPATADLTIDDLVAPLVDYPHGCAEQTLSRMIALLAADEAIGLTSGITSEFFTAAMINERLTTGWRRLGQLRHRRGFAMWPGQSSPWPWASVYAADVLTAAEAAGHAVPQTLRNHASSAIRPFLRDKDLTLATYAAWILARSGHSVDAHLDVLGERLQEPAVEGTTVAASLLALAWAELGLPGHGRSVLQAHPQSIIGTLTGARSQGSNLSSPGRDRALRVLALQRCDSDHADLPAAGLQLLDTCNSSLTTQERSWVIRALTALWRDRDRGQPASIAIYRGATLVKEVGPTDNLAWQGPWSADLRLVATGAHGSERLVRIATMQPATTPTQANGIHIRWQDDWPAAATVGEPITNTVQLTATTDLAHVVAVWPHPTGCQIEVTSDADGMLIQQHDDRTILLLPALAAQSRVTATVRLVPVTRAWTNLPAIHAEAMYDPTIAGGTESAAIRFQAAP